MARTPRAGGMRHQSRRRSATGIAAAAVLLFLAGAYFLLTSGGANHPETDRSVAVLPASTPRQSPSPTRARAQSQAVALQPFSVASLRSFHSQAIIAELVGDTSRLGADVVNTLEGCVSICHVVDGCTHVVHLIEPREPARTPHVSPQLAKELEELRRVRAGVGMPRDNDDAEPTSPAQMPEIRQVGIPEDTYQLFTINLNFTFRASVCILLDAGSSEGKAWIHSLPVERPEVQSDSLLVAVSRRPSKAGSCVKLQGDAGSCLSEPELRARFIFRDNVPSHGNPGFRNIAYYSWRGADVTKLTSLCLAMCVSTAGCLSITVRPAPTQCVLLPHLAVNAEVRSDHADVHAVVDVRRVAAEASDTTSKIHTFSMIASHVSEHPNVDSTPLMSAEQIRRWDATVDAATCHSAPAVSQLSPAVRPRVRQSCMNDAEVATLFAQRRQERREGSASLVMSSPIELVTWATCARWCLSFDKGCHDALLDHNGKCTIFIARDKVPADDIVDEYQCRPLMYDVGNVQRLLQHERRNELGRIEDGQKQRQAVRVAAGESRMSMKDADIEDKIADYANHLAELSVRRTCATGPEVASFFEVYEGVEYERAATVLSATAHSRHECMRLCLSFAFCVGGVISKDGVVCELKSIPVSHVAALQPNADKITFQLSASQAHHRNMSTTKLKDLEALFPPPSLRRVVKRTRKPEADGGDEDMVRLDAPNRQQAGGGRGPDARRDGDGEGGSRQPSRAAGDSSMSLAFAISASSAAVKDRLHPLLSTWMSSERGVVVFDGQKSAQLAAQVQNPNISVAFFDAPPAAHHGHIVNGRGAWKVFALLRSVVARFPESDFYVLCDDDTYVVTDNLRRLLQPHAGAARSAGPLYIGRKLQFGPLLSGYVDGAATIILNRRAAQAILDVVDVCEHFMFPFHFGDVRFGFCAQVAGVGIVQVENAFTNEPLARVARFPTLFDIKLPVAFHQYRSSQMFADTHIAVTTARATMERHFPGTGPGFSFSELLRHFRERDHHQH